MKRNRTIFGSIIFIAFILWLTRCNELCQETKLQDKAIVQRAVIADQLSGGLVKENELRALLSGQMEKNGITRLSGDQMDKEIKKRWDKIMSLSNYKPTGNIVYAEDLDQLTDTKTGELTDGSWDESPQMLKDFYLSGCRITNKNHEVAGLVLFATDIACTPGVNFDIKAPNINETYTLIKKGYDNNLGNYIVINYGSINILFAHTQTQLKEGDIINQGAIIGNTDKSGAWKGVHVHIEIRKNNQGELENIEYIVDINNIVVNKDSAEILKKRKRYEMTQSKYYFTHYDAGDVKQNDASPCIASSGKDICKLEKQGVRTMALTKDMRILFGIKLGDKVKLTGDEGCSGTYEVHDEMNCRFRGENAHDNGTCYNRDGSITNGNVVRPGTNYFIKGDVQGAGGACKIQKI